MKESMVRELYYGNFSPWERRRIRDPEYTALLDKMDDIFTYYKKLLSTEEYKKIEELQDLQMRANSIQDEELFAYAFCAGVQLMADVFEYQVP